MVRTGLACRVAHTGGPTELRTLLVLGENGPDVGFNVASVDQSDVGRSNTPLLIDDERGRHRLWIMPDRLFSIRNFRWYRRIRFRIWLADEIFGNDSWHIGQALSFQNQEMIRFGHLV